ncbi:hypothetical protein JD844_013128 [Phrynosoma platyrhinos]|uniref:V-SNARE coiled-coil homology domain-containing protein n=1 Tax=Phrynosoma platyrhinos TaxID=52577 RepID=A0ABQ7TM94_PHRPL|nr:hypothetical protein JD844_013128 [Phrynosoma platyrhinos]
MPLERFPSDSASPEFHMGKKKSLMKCLRTTVRKMFPFHQKASKKVMLHGDNPSEPLMPRSAAIRNKHQVLPKTSVQLDVNIVEQHNVEARRMTRMTRRISVVSLSPGIQKSYCFLSGKKEKNPSVQKEEKKHAISVVPFRCYIREPSNAGVLKECVVQLCDKIQTSLFLSLLIYSSSTCQLANNVDNLLDNISEKSVQLLALRGAELQQCESLGDKILQSSKQFQKVALRTTKKHKLKNVCFPCTFCCLKE